jgi:hypothetical protein
LKSLCSNYTDAILLVSCGLSLSQNEPRIIPIKPQKMPIVNALAILKFVTKSIGIVILSGFGGNNRYELAIIIAYNSTGIAMFSFDLEGLLFLFIIFFIIEEQLPSY